MDSDSLMNYLPIILIGAVAYFLIRPKIRAMLNKNKTASGAGTGSGARGCCGGCADKASGCVAVVVAG